MALTLSSVVLLKAFRLMMSSTCENTEIRSQGDKIAALGRQTGVIADGSELCNNFGNRSLTGLSPTALQTLALV
jgi:hypothetical protein